MNRRTRRKAAARKREVGDVMRTQTVRSAETDELYWFEEPEGWSPDQHALPADVVMHGPFRTDEEVWEDQKRVLLGPNCKVTEGGMWDPNWDRPQ